MGIDQLVSGGDVSNPTYESVTTDELSNGVAGANNTISRLYGEHLETRTVDGVQETDFDLTHGYDDYILTVRHFHADGTDGESLGVVYSYDGGSTFATGSYHITRSQVESDGTVFQGGGTSSPTGEIAAAAGNANGEHMEAEIHIRDPQNADYYTFCHYNATVMTADGNIRGVTGSITEKGTLDAVDVIRARTVGNNPMNDTTISLYGVMP